METRFKKTGVLVFGNGPRGTARVSQQGLTLAYDDGQPAHFRFADLGKVDFNGRNGMWTLHFKDGRKKLHFQTAGFLLWTGDRAAGQRFNDALRERAHANGVTVYTI